MWHKAKRISPRWRVLVNVDIISSRELNPFLSPKWDTLGVKLYCVYLWSCSGDLWSVEYPFIAITPRSTLNRTKFSISYTTCLTKPEEPSLPYYLPIAGGRIIGFIPFPRVLVLCEIQSVSSRIGTRVAVSISYDDNHCTTGTSNPTDTFTFGLIPMEKLWISSSLKLWVK